MEFFFLEGGGGGMPKKIASEVGHRKKIKSKTGGT